MLLRLLNGSVSVAGPATSSSLGSSTASVAVMIDNRRGLIDRLKQPATSAARYL